MSPRTKASRSAEMCIELSMEVIAITLMENGRCEAVYLRRCTSFRSLSLFCHGSGTPRRDAVCVLWSPPQASFSIHHPGAFELFLEYEPQHNGTFVETTGRSSTAPLASDGGAHIHRRRQSRLRRHSVGPSATCRGPIVRFLVQPSLTLVREPRGVDASVSPDGFVREALPLEGVAVQTQLTRCLGPLPEWPRSLAEPIAARFSMLHFTPVQRLGGSGSAYSIWDQLSLHPGLFEGMESIDSAVEAAAQEKISQLETLPQAHPMRKIWTSHKTRSANSAAKRLQAVLGEAKIRLRRLLEETAGSLHAPRDVRSPCSPLTLPTVADPPAVCFVPGERLTVADPEERWDPQMEARVEGAKMRHLADTIARLEREAGVMSMVDIVLNHTSADSPWLTRHPDAAFSLQNSPHLRPAWELDAAIRQFSAHVSAGDFASQGVHPHMDGPAMVHRAFSLLEGWIPRHVRLWEFYVMNVDSEEAALGGWLLSLITPSRQSQPTSLSSLAEEEEFVALRSAAPPVVLDPIWTPSSLQQGAEFIRWLRSVARGASSNFRTAGEALPDEFVDNLVQSLIDSGAVWNDGSGARWATHLSPDEVMMCFQRTSRCAEPNEADANLPWEDDRCLQEASAWARVLDASPKSDAPPGIPDGDPECLELPLLLGAADMWQSHGGATAAGGGRDKPSPWAASALASALSQYRRILLAVNFWLYRHYDEDWAAARGAIRGTAMHFWCEEQGGKGTVGEDGPFVPRYFLHVQPPERKGDKKEDGEEGWETLSDLKTHGVPFDDLVLACNGFIWGGDPEVDFTLPRACAAKYAQIVKQGPEMEFAVSQSDPSSGGLEDAVGIATSPLLTPHHRARDGGSRPDQAEDPWQPHHLPRITTPPSRLHELASAENEDDDDVATPPPQRNGSAGPARYVDGWIPVDTAAHMSPMIQTPETQRAEVVTDEAVSVTPWASGSEPASTPTSGQGERNRRGLLRSNRWRRLTLAGQALHVPPSIEVPVVAASTPYVRREVVIWGDCVKLRYGLSPRDSPWLWAHMQEYVKRMARVFHAVRLDNAHGTPIHVAAAMLDAAREERPHLYVNAELFTGDIGRDVEYVARLGINSLIREAMQAPSESELSHYVFRHGGTPIGSMRVSRSYVGELLPAPIPAILFDCTHDNAVPAQKRTAVDALSNAALVAAAVGGIGSVRGYDRCVPRALSVVSEYRWYVPPLRDDVDDGSITPESFRWPLQMTEIPDEYDDYDSAEGAGMVPAVQPPWEDGAPSDDVSSSLREGLLPVRRRLNELHQYWAKKGFSEVHVHHAAPPRGVGGDVVAVHRGHASSPFSFVTVTRTAFHGVQGMDHDFAPPMRLSGRVVGVELSASLEVPAFAVAGAPPEGEAAARKLRDKHRRGTLEAIQRGKDGAWTPSPVVVNGVPMRLQWYAPRNDGALEAARPLPDDPLGLGTWWEGDAAQGEHKERIPTAGPGCGSLPETLLRLDGKRFQPGSVLVLRLVAPRRPSIPTDSITFLPPASPAPELRMARSTGTRHAEVVWGPPVSSLEAVLMDTDRLTLPTLARLLYRAEPEERDDSGGGRGTYVVPGHGPLPWCGVAGAEHTLRPVRQWNNLGHPVCENIRQGPWLANYLVNRIRDEPALQPIATWMERHFHLVLQMPAGLQPYALDRIVSAVFHCAVGAILYRMRRSPLLLRLMGDVWDHVSPSENREGRRTPGGRSEGSRPRLSPRRLLHWVIDIHAAIAYMQHAAHPEQTTSSPVAAHAPQQQIPSRTGSRQENPKRVFRQETESKKMRDEERWNEAFRSFLTPAAPLPFAVALSLTSVQLFSNIRSAPLLDVPLLPERPCSERDGQAVERWVRAGPSLAAGVDHFCTGFMRNWGRDTFISLRGLMLLTGRFTEARTVLLAYATVVRHGLVPNLMDGGRRPRYNARDATWWFLQALQDYCTLSPEQDGILEEQILPRFPSDEKEDYTEEGDSAAGVPCFVYRHGTVAPKTLGAVVCDILRQHAQGISFVEWNAGPAIDANMKEPGFHVEISLDRRTGFLHGGNVHNCGTWMDKMGESDKFGTRGEPATPRDGAPVELTGLLYSTLRWASVEAGRGKLPLQGVWLPHRTERVWWSWHEWAHAVAVSFEAEYWVPEAAAEDTPAIDPSLVNVRGIYKDTVGGGHPWADYQLRPNQLVAMAVAPTLFAPRHAKHALSVVERRLIGCEGHQMGIRTLDPSDWAFRGNYDNDDESERATARGWNYHNGPAWLWPFGYYLRARLRFCPSEDDRKRWRPGAARRWVLTRTVPHRRHIASHVTGGLPELTQADGSPCAHSCAVQAWSSATLMDALYDAELVEERDFERLGWDA